MTPRPRRPPAAGRIPRRGRGPAWRAATACLAALSGLTATPRPSLADGLSRRDKLGVLYSNRLAFDVRGVPIVTVAVMEGGREVVVEAARPPRLLPDGEGGAAVVGPLRWRVVLERSRPAKVSYFVALARGPARGVAAVKKARATWAARGVKASIVEVGKIMAVAGRVLDNRRLVLAEGPFPTVAAARRAAARRRGQGTLPRHAILPRLVRRPSASLRVEGAGGVRVEARDAVWFAPAAGSRLRVGRGKGATRPYWGGVYVTVGASGALVVVNQVPADRLLEGLVPAEIFPSAPPAALRAQAVAARGELFRKTGTRHLVDPFLLCARTHCQVYAGAGHEHPRTSAAVAATRGLVLVEEDGRVVDTVYSAVCGGHTEDNDAVWPAPADAGLRGRLDAPAGALKAFRTGITDANIDAWLRAPRVTWCARSGVNRTRYRWRRRLEAAALSRRLRDLRVGPIRELRVLHRGRSGRATALAVRGALGQRVIQGELRIRRRLGGLPSSMMVITPVPGAGGRVTAFDVRGGGWGHGVGMCQSGAIGMARAGKGFRTILRHYYPKGALRKMY